MDILREVKWGYQRLVRGWDDRVLWSIDIWLDNIMIQVLSEFKKLDKGVPQSCINPRFIFESNGSVSKEGLNKGEKLWNEIIGKMIEGFEMSQVITGNANMDILEKYKDLSDTELSKMHNEKMSIFIENYHSLWN